MDESKEARLRRLEEETVRQRNTIAKLEIANHKYLARIRELEAELGIGG